MKNTDHKNYSVINTNKWFENPIAIISTYTKTLSFNATYK